MARETSDSIESLQVKTEAIVQEMTNLPLNHKFSCSSNCPFSEHDYSQSASAQRSKAATKLCVLIVCYLIVMVIEVLGGLKANSLAILTDAAHLLSDIAGFSISLFTVWVSGWKATPELSFGYDRIEVIGVLLSVQLIWVMSVSLIYEAIKRLITKQTEVNGKLMFGIAAFSLVVNLVLALWLGHDHSHHGHVHHGHSHSHSDHNCKDEGHSHEEDEETKTVDEESRTLVSASKESSHMLNINVRGAYLHIICDCIQSVAAMVAGVFIWIEPKWLVADLISTLVFTVFALSTTIPILRDIFCVLMERAPSDVDTAHLLQDLKLLRGVRDVHDLHVWAVSMGKCVMTCHVVVGGEVSSHEILHEIREYCERKHKINHVTIQVEQV